MSEPRLAVVYVAGPFRAPTPWAIERNIRRAEEVGFEVCLLGAFPLIPHANTRYFHESAPDQFFLDGTMELLRRCDALVLAPGWKQSAGTRAEVEEAGRLGISVFDWSSMADREDFARWLKAGGWR
jgi:hypothetical protein